MIEIPFALGSGGVALGWFLFRGGVCLKRKHFAWKEEAWQLLFLINLLVIYRVTFHPFEKLDGQVQPLVFQWETAWPFRVNWIPFVNLLDYDSGRDLLLNLIGNTTMFIPTGIITPILYKKWSSFGRTFLMGFSISLVIELLQLPFAVRASDVDDLILNTAGCVLGYGIYALFLWIKFRMRSKLK